METLRGLVTSPLLPPLLLLAGPVALSFAHPTRSRPDRLLALALILLGVSLAALVSQVFQRGLPLFALTWQPSLQDSFQFVWLHVGWNWNISLLAGILGAAGLLCSAQRLSDPERMSPEDRFFFTRFLALNLATLACVWLLVNSGNMLTTVFTWVLLDVMLVFRHTQVMNQHAVVQEEWSVVYHRALGMGMLGTLVLLIGLFPAGVNGPNQMLIGSSLPIETLYALFIAGAVRGGAYPLHLWLLPSSHLNLSVSERIFSQVLPALSGLWLLGLTLELAQRQPEIRVLVLPAITLMCLISAVVCLHRGSRSLRRKSVIVTSVSLTGLAAMLGFGQGPMATLSSVAACCLSGALWLVAQRLPPTRVGLALHLLGILGLLGMPLTPGFIALGRWLAPGTLPPVSALSATFLLAVLVFSASLWRPWLDAIRRMQVGIPLYRDPQLGAACLLAVSNLLLGIVPGWIWLHAGGAELPSLWESLGQLRSPMVLAYTAVATGGGLSVGWMLTRMREPASRLLHKLTLNLSLEWVSGGIQFGAARISVVWSNTLNMIEGSGLVGWSVALLVLLRAILR